MTCLMCQLACSMTVAAGLKNAWLLLWNPNCGCKRGEPDRHCLAGLATSSFLIASSALQICLPALGTLGQRTMMRR